jgi:uncharacterized protein (DUF488 family)
VTTLFTVGHGARPLGEFIEILLSAGIEVLGDVRRFPHSRRHPHFGREALVASLAEHGITYEWLGEKLGGHRKAEPADSARHRALRNSSFRAYAAHMDTPDFREAFTELQRRGSENRVAIMCAETPWWRCHRRLIADALVVQGCHVVHLGLAADAPHRLSESARVDEDGLLNYDVDTTAQEGLVPLEAD